MASKHIYDNIYIYAMPTAARFDPDIIWELLFEWCALFHPADPVGGAGLQEVKDNIQFGIKGIFLTNQ